MATKLDNYKALIKKNHPEWDEATINRMAESRLAADNSTNKEGYDARDEEGVVYLKDNSLKGIVNYMAENATQKGQDVSDWASNIISDEQSKKSQLANAADQILTIGGDIFGGTIRAVGSTPKFVGGVGALAFGDNTEWGGGKLLNRVDELESQGVNKVQAWSQAVAEGTLQDAANGENKNLAAQTVDQIINNPIATWGLGRLFKGSSKLLKGASKVDKVVNATEKTVAGATNIADDAAKVSKGWLGKVSDTVSSIKQKGSNIVEKIAKSKLINNPITNNKVTKWAWSKGKGFVEGAMPGVQTISDLFVKPAAALGKGFVQGYKATGIAGGLRQGLGELFAHSLDTAGKFISNPYSYRLPRIRSYDQAQKMFGETLEARAKALDTQEFYEDHGYTLSQVAGYKDDSVLNDWYDEQGIAKDKRLTLDQIRQEIGNIGGSTTNNILSGIRDTLSFLDPWGYNERFYEGAKSLNTGTLTTTETTPRGRLRTGGGLNIDLETSVITDDDGNTIDINNLTKEQQEDIMSSFLKLEEGDYSGVVFDSEVQGYDDSINITGLDLTNPASQLIESMAQNGLLTQGTVNTVIKGDKSRDAVYITTQLNEASKQFVNAIVNLYTPEELNNNPSKQDELIQQFGAYQRLFDETAKVIEESSSDVYNQSKGGVYRFREAMSDALARLSERDRNLINSNLYQQAIDYNNSLEEGIDKTWISAATNVKRWLNENVVDSVLRDEDSETWDKLGFAGLGDTAVNPTVVGTASMLGDVRSALASNADYLIATSVVNFLNNNIMEKYLGEALYNGVSKKILPSKALASKGVNFGRGAWTEMTSEPLENFLDAMSMVDDPNHDYSFMPGLLVGMLQGGLAGYASSRSNYSTINDYFADPRNRTMILNNMGLDLNKITDPKKKAISLAVTSQAFDNVIGVMKDVYSEADYGVEGLAQGLAITLVNRDMADYATDILNQAQQAIITISESNGGSWSENEINQVFASDADFRRYLDGQSFKFNQSFIDGIRNSSFNQEKFNKMSQRAQALIVTAQSIKGNSLQEVFDKMTPHVNKEGLPIKPNLTKESLTAEQTMYNILKPGNPAVTNYVVASTLMGINSGQKTIGDMLGIGKGSELWNEKKGDYKKNITRTNEAGKKERVSIRDVIIEKINSQEGLSPEQRGFIASMLFKTSVLGINSYFKSDGSLSRLGKDFFNSVMPSIEGSAAIPQWQQFITADYIIKVSESNESRTEALKERGSETKKIQYTVSIGGEKIPVGTKVEDIPDGLQVQDIVKDDGQPYTTTDLKKDKKVSVRGDGVLLTVSVEDGTLTRYSQIDNTELLEGKPEDFPDATWIETKNNGYTHKTKDELEEELNNLEQEKLGRQQQRKDAKNNGTTLDYDYQVVVGKLNKKIRNLRYVIEYMKKHPDLTFLDQRDQPQPQKILEGNTSTTATIEDKTDEEIAEEEGDTRVSGIFGSIDNVKDLCKIKNRLASKLPLLNRRKNTVNIKLSKDANLVDSPVTLDNKSKILGQDLWTLSSSQLNSDAARSEYQVIRIKYKGESEPRKYYAVPQLNYKINREDGEEPVDGDAVWFNSFVLVDFDGGEHIEKEENIIFRGPLQPIKNNNYIYNVIGADGKPVKGNRIVNFTKSYNGDWKIATAIQLNRLSAQERKRAYNSGKVFMSVPAKYKTPTGRKKNAIIDVELDNGEVIQYDTRNIYTTADLLLDPNAESLNIDGFAPINITDKNFDITANLLNQEEYGKDANVISEDLQEDNENLILTDPTRITKELGKDIEEMQDLTNQTYEEGIEAAEEMTDDPTVSEEQSINEYNKQNDPNIYIKARNLLNLLVTESDGTPIEDMVDLTRLSNIMYYGDEDSKSKEKYYNAIKNCIKVDLSEMTSKDIYQLINKISFIQDTIDYKIQQGQEDLLNLYFMLSGLYEVVCKETPILNGLFKQSGNTTVENAKDMNIKDFIVKTMNNGYSPIEVGISLDDKGNIINITYGDGYSSMPTVEAKSFVHSHPNGSFFSPQDIRSADENGYKSIGLILPGGVILNYNTELLKSNIGNIKNRSLAHSIVIAISLSLEQGNINDQSWGLFQPIVDEAIADRDDAGAINEIELEEKANSIAFNIYKSIGQEIKSEAFKYEGGQEAFYLKNNDNIQKFVNTSFRKNLLSDDITNLTDIEKDTAERYLKDHYIQMKGNNFEVIKKAASDNGGIYTLRGNTGRHFGNPFGAQGTGATVVVDSAEEAVSNYWLWLTGQGFKDVEPNRREWIVDQIMNGSLKNKTLYYYTDEIPSAWNGGNYSKLNKFGNTQTYSYSNDYNELGNRAYNHAMVLGILINNPGYIKHATRLKINEGYIKKTNDKRLIAQFKNDMYKLGASNRLIGYTSASLYTPLLYQYKQWNSTTTNVGDYNSTDTVYVTIPNYSKINQSVNTSDYNRYVSNCIRATLSQVELAASANAQFVTGLKAENNEKELFEKLKDLGYKSANIDGKYLLWMKDGMTPNKMYNVDQNVKVALDAIVSNEESEILKKIEKDGLPDIHPNQQLTNEQIVEKYSNIFDGSQKAKIVEDLESLGLSLVGLDKDTLGEFFNAYANGKGLDDVIKLFAQKTMQSKIDIYLKNLLVKNGVLQDNVEYDGRTIEESISIQGCIDFLKKIKYNNLTPNNLRNLRNELYNSNVINEFFDNKEDKIKFITLYTELQVLQFDPGYSDWSRFVENQKVVMRNMLNVFKKQSEKRGSTIQNDLNEDDICEAITATDGLKNKKADVVEALTEHYITNIFKMNYLQASQDFKNAVSNAISDSLEDDRVEFVGDINEDNTNKGFEFIKELSSMSDDMRYQMAVEMKRAGLIGQGVYNYLMHIDPTVTYLNEGQDYASGLLGSLIVKLFDNNMLGGIDGIQMGSDRDKLKLFLDIYRYYSFGGTSYKELVQMLDEKYDEEDKYNSGIRYLIALLKVDSAQTENGLYSDDVISKVLERKKTYRAEDGKDPYKVFIKDLGDGQGNKKIIVDALSELYFVDNDSFFGIIQYTPADIKKQVAKWMQDSNAKIHGNNIALGMVLSFLSDARTKEVLDAIAKEKTDQAFVEGSNVAIKNAAREILKEWDDLVLSTNTEITRELYEATGIDGLDPTLGTVLLTDGNDKMPSSWESFEGCIQFPLKNIKDLGQLKANVNVIVPEKTEMPSNLNGVFNIVKIRAGVKDGMLMYNPGGSYKSSSTIEMDVMSGLGHIGLDINIQEGFKFTNDQIKKINNKRFDKGLYWEIFKQIVVPQLTNNDLNVSREKFESLIDDNTMRHVNGELIYASIASKSVEDKIAAATMLINQVTNGQLAFKVDVAGTDKSIDFVQAAEDFESKMLSLLDPKDENYERDRKALTKFYSAYLSALMKLTNGDQYSSLETAGLVEDSFNYLMQTYSAAIGRLEDLWNKNNYPLSMYAYIPGEYESSREGEYIGETVEEVLSKKAGDIEISPAGLKRIQILENRKKFFDVVKQLSNPDLTEEKRASLLRLKSRYASQDGMTSDIDIDEDGNTSLYEETGDEQYEDFNDVDSAGSYDYSEEATNGIKAKDQSYAERTGFIDKKNKVFATLFNSTISNNLIDVDSNNITYDENGDNKYISLGVLSVIDSNTLSIINNEVSSIQEDQDAERDALSVNKKDLLGIQAILSSNKNDIEQLDKLLNRMFSISDKASSTDPMKIKFDNTKEMIRKDPDSFTNIISKLMEDQNVGFDIKGMKVIINQKYDNIKLEVLQKNIAHTVIQNNFPITTDEELKDAHKQYDQDFTDPEGNILGIPGDDQIEGVKTIVDMYNDRTDLSKSKNVFVAGMAGAGKTTMVVAALKAIQRTSGAYGTDLDRIAKGTQTVISDNFDNKYADKLFNIKRNHPEEEFRIKISLSRTGQSGYIKFKGKDIKTHDELVKEYKDNEEQFLIDYHAKTGNYWSDDGLKTLFEMGEGFERGSKSRTRYVIENLSPESYYDVLPDGITESFNFSIHGLGNNVSIRDDQNLYDKNKSKSENIIQGSNPLKDVYILTKTNSTVQTINDKIGKQNGLQGVNFATMDSRKIQQSSAGFSLYGYGDTPEIRSDKDLSGKLILIDEAQNADDPTLQAMIKGYGGKNMLVFLGDTKQMSQGSMFADEVNKGDNVIRLDTLFRGTQDQQDVNKMNSLIQDLLIEAGAMAVFPIDSDSFVQYDNVDDLFDLEGTTMFVAGTNDRVAEINRIFFDWATKNNKPIPAMIIDARSSTDTSVAKGEMNKRYHKGIDLSKYTKDVGEGVYTRIDGNDVYVFVPYVERTDKKNVARQRTRAEKKFPGKTVRILSTAFAITTHKESGKTVDNIILDEGITDPVNEYYVKENVRQTYDSFTRGDKKTYFKRGAKKVLTAPMQQIRNLIHENNPYITLSAPVSNIKTIEQNINMPIFIVDQGEKIQRTIDIANKIEDLYTTEGVGASINELMELRSMRDSLNIVYHIDNVENKGLKELDQSQGINTNNDYARGNGLMLQGIQKDIALRWDRNNKKIKKGIKKNDKKMLYTYNMINGWVYGKTINIPKIRGGVVFTSTNAANSQVSFDNMLKAHNELRDGHKGKFFNYKKSIDANGKEVRSLVPADIERDETIRQGILNRSRDNLEKRYEDLTENEKELKRINRRVTEGLISPEEGMYLSEDYMVQSELEQQEKESIYLMQGLNFRWGSQDVNEETTCKL